MFISLKQLVEWEEQIDKLDAATWEREGYKEYEPIPLLVEIRQMILAALQSK